MQRRWSALISLYFAGPANTDEAIESSAFLNFASFAGRFHGNASQAASLGMIEDWPRQGRRWARWYRMNDA
jgi:hypothetical protein